MRMMDLQAEELGWIGVIVVLCVLLPCCIRESPAPKIEFEIADGFDGFFEITPSAIGLKEAQVARIPIAKPSTETEYFGLFSQWHQLGATTPDGAVLDSIDNQGNPGEKRIFELSGNRERKLFLLGTEPSEKWFWTRGDFPSIETLRKEHAEFMRKSGQ